MKVSESDNVYHSMIDFIARIKPTVDTAEKTVLIFRSTNTHIPKSVCGHDYEPRPKFAIRSKLRGLRIDIASGLRNKTGFWRLEAGGYNSLVLWENALGLRARLRH